MRQALVELGRAMIPRRLRRWRFTRRPFCDCYDAPTRGTRFGPICEVCGGRAWGRTRPRPPEI